MQQIFLDGSSTDPGWILALMFFPNDEILREQSFISNCLHNECSDLRSDSNIEIDVKTINLLLCSPSREELKKMGIESTKKGVVAGDILAMVYLMNVFKDKDPAFARPSINKAIEFAAKFGLMTEFGDGEVMYRSTSKIRACWDEFKPVAHLWAAHRIGQAYSINDGTNFESLDALHRFLAVSKDIFEFGCSFIPLAAKPQDPILNRTASWLIPDSIKPMKLVSETIPDQLLKYAREYKVRY